MQCDLLDVQHWNKLRFRSSVHEVFQRAALIEVLLEEKLGNLLELREQRARQTHALAAINLRQLAEILLLCYKLAMESFVILWPKPKEVLLYRLKISLSK